MCAGAGSAATTAIGKREATQGRADIITCGPVRPTSRLTTGRSTERSEDIDISQELNLDW